MSCLHRVVSSKILSKKSARLVDFKLQSQLLRQLLACNAAFMGPNFELAETIPMSKKLTDVRRYPAVLHHYHCKKTEEKASTLNTLN